MSNANFSSGPWSYNKATRAIGPVSADDDQSYGMVFNDASGKKCRSKTGMHHPESGY